MHSDLGVAQVVQVTVVDEAVTVVDDPTVQHRVIGLSVGQENTAGSSALRSASVMVMR